MKKLLGILLFTSVFSVGVQASDLVCEDVIIEHPEYGVRKVTFSGYYNNSKNDQSAGILSATSEMSLEGVRGITFSIDSAKALRILGNMEEVYVKLEPKDHAGEKLAAVWSECVVISTSGGF